MSDKELVYRIIGSAIDVYRNLGHGLLESIYQEALEMELDQSDILCETEKEVPVFYKGMKLRKKFRLDMLINDKIIVELKSVSKLGAEHRIQLCNYLRLTQKPIGLLINFGVSPIIGERWMYDKHCNECFLVNKDMQPVSIHSFEDE